MILLDVPSGRRVSRSGSRSDACQARELAFELLELAEQADQIENGPAMTVKTPAPPPLPGELERLLHRLRLPYVRRAAPDVIATATAQRWEHAEVLKVLLAEEAAGRDQATIRTRRRASGLPAGKTFDAWEPERSVIPAATQQALRTLEWIDRHEVLAICGPSRDRQEALHRSARAPRDRQGPHRRVAHARDARATPAPPPRR